MTTTTTPQPAVTVGTTPLPITIPLSTGIRIAMVRVYNFRCLKEVEVELDDVTILIGQNNAGKTSLIQAIAAALGDKARTIQSEDVYIAPEETKAPPSRTVTIDLLIRPSTGATFDAKWNKRWGGNVEVKPDTSESVTIRTTREWNAGRGEHEVKRAFLTEWPKTLADRDSATLSKNSNVTASILQAFALYVIDAKRDIREDLRNKGSFWSRMTEELRIPEATVLELENVLAGINTRIITESPVLTHVQQNLDDLVRTLAGKQDSVKITPVTRQLRDLQDGMDILFATSGAQSFPIARHGMGTRSLASILTFRAYMRWKQQNLGNEVLHPFLALEEPEAHLHPQAQRAIFRETLALPGQRIVSTHSPYVAGQASIRQLRHFKRTGPDTVITKLDPSSSSLNDDDLRKIEQNVMITRGELLFARAIILFEGQTEEAALPIFAETYWKDHHSVHGLSFLPGCGCNYKPFLRMAHAYDIPWFILSDGEPNPRTAVQAALDDIVAGPLASHPRVAALPNGQDLETYLIDEGYAPELTAALADAHDDPDYLANYIAEHDTKVGKKNVIRDYKGADGPKRALQDAMRAHKTKTAKPMARRITQTATPARRIPAAVKQVFDAVSTELDLPRWTP